MANLTERARGTQHLLGIEAGTSPPQSLDTLVPTIDYTQFYGSAQHGAFATSHIPAASTLAMIVIPPDEWMLCNFLGCVGNAINDFDFVWSIRYGTVNDVPFGEQLLQIDGPDRWRGIVFPNPVMLSPGDSIGIIPSRVSAVPGTVLVRCAGIRMRAAA